MIDFKKAQKQFKQYLNSYDLDNGLIQLKVRHTYGVVSLSEYIAKDLNLSEEDIELAKLIALLHDIARFEQAKEFGDYRDYKNVDHADLAVKILFEDNLIRNFVEEDKYDSIILKSIKNHNKLQIEDGLNEKELLHAKIIRDADKIDILYIMTFEEKRTVFNKDDISDEKITDKIYEEFMQMKLLDYKKIQTNVDRVIAHFAYIYDFNFNFSYEYVNNKQYLDKIYKRHTFTDNDTMKRYNLIYDTAKKYIKEKTK